MMACDVGSVLCWGFYHVGLLCLTHVFGITNVPHTQIMFAQIVWLEETLQAAAAGNLRSGELNFADRVFQNEIDSAIQETRQVHLPAHVMSSPHKRFFYTPWYLETTDCTSKVDMGFPQNLATQTQTTVAWLID